MEEQVKRLEAEKKALEQAVKEKEEKAATKVWNDLWDTSLRGYEEGENDFENAEDENTKQGSVVPTNSSSSMQAANTTTPNIKNNNLRILDNQSNQECTKNLYFSNH